MSGTARTGDNRHVVSYANLGHAVPPVRRYSRSPEFRFSVRSVLTMHSSWSSHEFGCPVVQ